VERLTPSAVRLQLVSAARGRITRPMTALARDGHRR